MRDRESTARAREIGSLLRKMREKADIKSADLARTLGWSVAKLSRTELGLRVITELDAVRFTAYCGASHYEVNHMAARCREAEIPGYWLTDRISSLIFHESATNSMVCYQPMIIPGLLQTFDYAMALIAPRQPVPAFARHHAEVRMQRQHILRGRPFTFFIHEQALRLPVGGSQVMNEQLLKLVLLAEHPSLSIRVVPTVAGERAMLGGQFALMWFPDAPPLSYVETGPARLFLEASEYLDWYRAQVGTIGEVALNRGQSRKLLAALASEIENAKHFRAAPDPLADVQL